MHYRLKAIKGVLFGVVNIASHFICIQLFQMEISALPLILFASKYSRYNFRGWNEQFQITTKAWKGPSWTFFMILRYFTQELLPKYFQKDIYYFRSPFSLWWGPSRRSLFWTFFTCQGPLNHHAKFRPPPSPPYTLLREFPKSWQILSSKSFFSVQNMGHTRTNCAVFYGV